MKRLIFLIAIVSFTFQVSALVKPSSLFCDHMVLQRNAKIPVWGTANPGEKITVEFFKRKKSTKADKNGNWKVKLNKLSAGGPYSIKIKGSNEIIINDIYIGDVWLCSGQSNMDMTVAKEDRYWCGVTNEAEEVANANYPQIRVYDVDFTPNNKIQENAKGIWEVCSPSTVGHFSAAAYFFAKELYDKYEVPIGLMTSAYGASTAESWISEKSLKKHPNLKWLLDDYTAKYEKFAKDSINSMPKYRQGLKDFAGNMAEFKASQGDVTSQKNDQNRKAPKAPKNPDPMIDQHNPYVCYNGMIAPLTSYPITGAIWYQGESNGPSAKNYREIMETLVEDWRGVWKQGSFPFIYVQIANYGKPMLNPVEDGPMMTVREAQVQNLSIPNTAMVCAIENAGDEPTNIHPKNKQEIGYRLSLAARALAYGEKVVYSGPLYSHYQVENNTIRLFFSNLEEGIVAWNTRLTGFAICGEDRNFVWANARFDGNTIVVSSPTVQKPVAVRYCWGTNPPASISNLDGLWTPNFRTDNW